MYCHLVPARFQDCRTHKTNYTFCPVGTGIQVPTGKIEGNRIRGRQKIKLREATRTKDKIELIMKTRNIEELKSMVTDEA